MTAVPAGEAVMDSEAIRIEGLHKSFGANEVLKGIDLTVATHEVVCLIGASGSGKSTLLRCVNLLEPIDSGRISLWGQQITGPGINGVQTFPDVILPPDLGSTGGSAISAFSLALGGNLSVAGQRDSFR